VGGPAPAPALHLLPADVFRHVLRFVPSPPDAIALAASFRGAGALVASAQPAWAAWHDGWAPRAWGRREWEEAGERLAAAGGPPAAAGAASGGGGGGGEGPSKAFLRFRATWALAVAARRERDAEDAARRRRAHAAAALTGARLLFPQPVGPWPDGGGPVRGPLAGPGVRAPPLRGPGGIGLGGFGFRDF